MFVCFVMCAFFAPCMLSVIYFSCIILQSSCFILIRGESSGCQPQEVLEQVELLKANIADLEIQERELDIQKACLQQSIKHLNEDSSVCRYPYCQCMCQKQLSVFLPSHSRLKFFHFWVVLQVIKSPRKCHCWRTAPNYMLNVILPGPPLTVWCYFWVFMWPQSSFSSLQSAAVYARVS